MNKMKFFLALFFSYYIFIILGFIFHTSSSPQILGKYTYNYFIYLIIFIVFLPISLVIINKVSKISKIKFRNKKYNVKLIHKVALAIVAFLLIFFILESFLGVKYRGKDPTSYLYSIENYHPFLQFQLTKDSNLNINSDNFRASEISANKSENEYRIFILGGSTVLNSSVNYDNLFSKLLEDKLRKQYPGKKILVINAGNDGFNTEHSLIQYIFKIKDFEPDLIIFWQGINDMLASCNNQNNYGEYKNDYSHVFNSTMGMVTDRFLNRPVISINSISFKLGREILKDNFYSDFDEIMDKKNSSSGVYTNEKKYQFYDLTNIPSLSAYNRNLETFVEILNADKISLILANQASVYKDEMTTDEKNILYFAENFCKENNKYPTIKSMKKSLEKFNKSTEDIASENNILFIDLNSKIPKDLNHFTDDIHYTTITNRLISDILFNEITSNAYIK